MYKTGSAWSRTDTGGKEMDCPLCMGKGEIEIPKVVSGKDIEKTKSKDAKKYDEKNKLPSGV
jgi:hypothetical protein